MVAALLLMQVLRRHGRPTLEAILSSPTAVWRFISIEIFCQWGPDTADALSRAKRGMGEAPGYVAPPPASTCPPRAVIAALLSQRQERALVEQRQQAALREAQRDRTRSLVRLQQLDTRDEVKIALHAESAAHYNQRAAVLEQIRLLQARYQAEKKRLPAIQDKKERHERLQRAKASRDKDVAVLRQHLAHLEAAAPPVVRPGSSSVLEKVGRAATPAGVESLPQLPLLPLLGGKRKKSERVSATEYKQLMDQIRAVKQERNTMLDPLMASLKLARLWDRLHDTARCLENYDAACRMMKDKELARIPPEMLEEVLEKQRLRRRAALHFLFSRALQRKQRQEAADLLSKFLELSLPEERLKDLAYVDRILREQEYIEDPTLASADEIMFAIRTTNSLGHLTDLRFELLKELLGASPTDSYLIESVANIHVRRGEFAAAEELTARFVALPPVKRLALYATLAELRCGI